MDFVRSYNDLCNEIEISEVRVDLIRKEIKAIDNLGKIIGPKEIKGINYDLPKVQEHKQIGFEDWIGRRKKLEEILVVEMEILEKQYEAKDKMDEMMKRLTGIHFQVAYLHKIKGIPLKNVAEMLCYEYSYIKKISYQCNQQTG